MHVLERLRQFMASQRGTTVMLNAPADNHQLTAAESVMGIKFPREIREAYACFNGVVRDEPLDKPCGRPRGPELFLEGCDWVDLDRVVAEWQGMRKVEAELKASGVWRDVPDREISHGLRMRPVTWHPKWIPIGIGGGGINLVCVDLAPTRSGTPGQLVHTGDAGPVIAANSFFSYLERLFDAVDEGKLVVDENGAWRSRAGAAVYRLSSVSA